ncbi:MAG: type VI secretion system ATPase TssH, partial [Syntrophobacteraceae bacterium]|nr:type VI secretion system ATPase TssH [Syntrophobacteraceae bacterium]
MDLNRFTMKSQEAIQAAQARAIRFGHTEVDGEHLLVALLEQSDGLVPKLLQRMEIPVERVRERLEEELARKPRVSGTGIEAGKVYISQRLSRLLLKAQEEAQRLKDEYVSVEHLLVAFAEEGSVTPAGRVLQEFRITKDAILATLTA